MKTKVKEEPAQEPILSAELPAPVVHEFDAAGGRLEQVRLVVKSDLAPDGRFGEQWLMIDNHDLWVVSRQNGAAHLRYKIPLDQVEDAKVERCVGNGLIQVTVDRQPRVLLHYSNELTDRFGRVAHYLHERAENGSDVPIPDPEADSRQCLVCGRRLVDSSFKVCPSCIQRGKVLKRLIGLARPFWGKMTAILLLLLGGVLVDLLPPYLTRILIDDVLRAGANPDWLIWLVGGLLIIQVVRVVITILTNWMTINVEQGPPHKLMENKGAFYQLVQLQTQFARLDGVAAL